MTSFFDWTPDDAVAVPVDVGAPGGWDQIRSIYTGGRLSPPLERVIEIASQNGVTDVLIERRYIDLDWRSEHSHFY